ncbi:uncharacterized protein LOC112054315 [Bicyclus anynana]|uniref:Uncharacterized protein LOC112054315 n=1 Tax=Bicyclus anynana TaxID=110368 RepID=A0A6J1NX31_BICAN|nr:uncharacterized protein LOC112054315 [Bicyclus anynana]
MLDKFRSIKPTHLWHLTSLKAFRAAIKDRYEVRKNMDTWFYKPGQSLAFAGFIWLSTLAFFYSIAAIKPGETFKHYLPYDCQSPSGPNMDDCKKQPKTPPCPPTKKKEC